MHYLETVPAFIKILLVFALVLLAIRQRLSLGNAFVIGAVCLGLIFRMPLPSIATSMLHSMTHLKTLSLAVIVSLILVLSHSLEAGGQMARLLDRFQGLVRHAGLNLVVFPALIGLLPMPGGAIFSAPMVKNLGRRRQLSGAQLSYVNYWFRHIWEYWWPLYPGVLLTTAMAGIDLWHFVVFLFPITIAAAGFGFWPLRSLSAKLQQDGISDRSDHSNLKAFFYELQPILLVIVLGLGLGAALTPLLEPYRWDISKEIGLIVSLLIAIGWVWRRNRLPAEQRRKILLRRELLLMIYMVLSIMIFEEILRDSQAAEAVSAELIRWRIPLFSITIILPMLVGMVCGITIAFVGTTFPILISLVVSTGQGDFMLAYLMLGIVSGFVGVLFSPLHMCLMLSNQYFKTSLTKVYRHLLPPCCGLLLTACVYCLILIS
jgi:integral membrane protein (TIGR00529 family)